MSTEQGPITINNLITKLKLLPGDWKIEVSNSDGQFYIEDIITTNDSCILSLTLIPKEDV